MNATFHDPNALPRRPGIFMDAGRALLIIISILVALAGAVILLPQETMDALCRKFQARQGLAPQERIALLYLSNNINEGEFRLRGVIRNISTLPIEQLDATIRFYAGDGTSLETVLVRLDKESIAPNDFARLDLVIPRYTMNFSGYTVEFKLREGLKIAYKDMRSKPAP